MKPARVLWSHVLNSLDIISIIAFSARLVDRDTSRAMSRSPVQLFQEATAASVLLFSSVDIITSEFGDFITFEFRTQ